MSNRDTYESKEIHVCSIKHGKAHSAARENATKHSAKTNATYAIFVRLERVYTHMGCLSEEGL